MFALPMNSRRDFANRGPRHKCPHLKIGTLLSIYRRMLGSSERPSRLDWPHWQSSSSLTLRAQRLVFIVSRGSDLVHGKTETRSACHVSTLRLSRLFGGVLAGPVEAVTPGRPS
jgi:hypothetical protein